jgi:hypothetical protein
VSRSNTRHTELVRALRFSVSVVVAAALGVLGGCSASQPTDEPGNAVGLASVNASAEFDGMPIPSTQAWTETGFDVRQGEAISIVAAGRVSINEHPESEDSQPISVGPQGTFEYADAVINQQFPLPAADGGPAPAYCLIGRIGEGQPFYVGRKASFTAKTSGVLQLGINDFDLNNNAGQWSARVTKPETVQPIGFEQIVSSDSPPGEPQAGSSVVVFYVDGLRPDVVREMAAMGHLPTIRKLFIDGGTWIENAFTAFPSDTITSNGTMWTGCFSDRHGLKGQVRFSRRTLHSDSYLETLGPNRSARLLAPQGIEKFIEDSSAATVGWAKGEEEKRRWQQSRTTGVPPLYAHLRASGSDWATGILPIMTNVPPLLWTRSMMRHLPYFQSQNAWQYIDDANTHYAKTHLLSRNQPVTIIWLPETDSVSHKKSRGQFGLTRRTIAKADRLIEEVVSEVAAQGRLQSTYFLLISDHGHHGGDEAHLSHFDIANELLFKPRELDENGRWVDGGLGLSVRQHRFWNRHPEDDSRSFAFIDGDSDGAARIFLPKGHYRSGQWGAPNRPADLLAYRISEKHAPLNLVASLTATRVERGEGHIESPIDLVLMKASDDSILISTADRGQAIVHRKRDSAGRWLYKYIPVAKLEPREDGDLDFQPAVNPQVDPLKLLAHLPPRLLEYYHDEKTWLRLTARSAYPDSVVTLTRHLLWQENLKYRETEFAPDLVVTARRNWYFGTASSPGTMHGYPLPESMRASWFVSGPNVRRGARVVEPCRLVDLTPTLLDMTGTPFNQSEFDGTPVRSMYRTTDSSVTSVSKPFYWNDVDTHAWSPLRYKPLSPYEHLPVTVNRPNSPFDLNNAVYNVLSIGDLSALRLLDDVFSPLSSGQHRMTRTVESADSHLRKSDRRWVGEGVEAFNVSGVSLSDYSLTSSGNLKRADSLIDWTQNRLRETDRRLAHQLGRKDIPGSRLVHGTIDTTQAAYWEVYRFAERVVVQVIDETILNGIEDGAARTINRYQAVPAEIQRLPAN